MEKKEILQKLLKYRYAHRGLHDKPVVPENSMAAFGLAVEEGFGIELDIHLTKDNKLAVIHDSSLKRTCGIDLKIEDISLSEAQVYFLEKSNETIPAFEDVLELVKGRSPLIIELKTAGKNYESLCRLVMEVLQHYDGLYCIESFDPMAVRWLKKNRPDVIRGQLAGSLKGEGAVNSVQEFLLKNLWVNILSRPDFVAYRFEDRKEEAFSKFKGAKFLWTVREYSDLKKTEAEGASAIFEKFNPKDYE